MKWRLKIALAYLLLLALSGCAIQPGDKTVVLPTPRATENANEQTEENDWTVRRIRQCEVVTGCVDEENQSVALGWSNGKLYVVEGAAGQAVSVRCVDPRYGFFETCAVLGKIDYERLKLSPDGSALLYTVRKEMGETELYLYRVKQKKAEKVADIPFLSPYLGVDFCWTADGSRFFYWVTSSFSDKPYQMEMEMYGGEVPPTQEYWARIRGNIYLNQIMRGDAKTGNVKTVLAMHSEMPISENRMEVFGEDLATAFLKEVSPSEDGSCVLARYLSQEELSWKYVYADCETGEYKMRQIERLENLIPTGKSYSIEQVTQDGFLLNTYEKKDVSIELYQERGTLKKISSMNSGEYWYTDMQMAPDGSHVLAVEHRMDGESAVSVYSTEDGGRKLLYQTARPIVSVHVTPDGKQVLICTVSGTQVTENQDGYVEDDNKVAFIVTILEI